MWLVVAILSSILYKLSFDDVIDGVVNGVSKMVKPVILMVLAYSIFVIVYWSPIVPTITHAILSGKFNAIKTAFAALISSFFTADFGYVGYTVGQYLSAAYTNSLDKIFVIYPSMHGLIQMFSPTSVILLAGLAYSKVSYKEWFKQIWKFVLAMLIISLIIFKI